MSWWVQSGLFCRSAHGPELVHLAFDIFHHAWKQPRNRREQRREVARVRVDPPLLARCSPQPLAVLRNGEQLGGEKTAGRRRARTVDPYNPLPPAPAAAAAADAPTCQTGALILPALAKVGCCESSLPPGALISSKRTQRGRGFQHLNTNCVTDFGQHAANSWGSQVQDARTRERHAPFPELANPPAQVVEKQCKQKPGI